MKTFLNYFLIFGIFKLEKPSKNLTFQKSSDSSAKRVKFFFNNFDCNKNFQNEIGDKYLDYVGKNEVDSVIQLPTRSRGFLSFQRPSASVKVNLRNYVPKFDPLSGFVLLIRSNWPKSFD